MKTQMNKLDDHLVISHGTLSLGAPWKFRIKDMTRGELELA